MPNKTLFFFIGFLCVFAIAVSAAYMGGLLLPRASVVSPHIVPVSSDLPPIISTHTYPFEEGVINITVPVSDSVYQEAKLTAKETTLYGNVSEEIWVTDSYRSMVNDPAQDEIYRALNREFEKIKTGHGFSDDEYVELMTTFVQSLRYETLADNPVKFPVETVVDGSGDCDDKSLLLAGLLSREGYRVALLSFGPEAHMAVGTASENYLYKNTNYTFIETTKISYVGTPAEALTGNLTLQSNPVIIPIGNGTKVYTSGKETRYINDMYVQSELKAFGLEPQIRSLESDLKTRQEKITQLEVQMQQLKISGNILDYNAQVSVHNTMVSDYNTLLNTYRGIFGQYERYFQIHNYILEHEFDRVGVYEYVKKNLPA